MTEKDRDWLRRTLHREFRQVLKTLDVKLKGRRYATVVTDALAEQMDETVEACIDLADEESG